jgi:hypothetical protein
VRSQATAERILPCSTFYKERQHGLYCCQRTGRVCNDIGWGYPPLPSPPTFATFMPFLLCFVTVVNLFRPSWRLVGRMWK